MAARRCAPGIRVALLLLAAVCARAEDGPADVAQRVAAAVRSDDAARVRDLAKSEADSWLVVLWLADAGDHDAAARFVQALPDRPDAAQLRAYIELRRAGKPDPLAAILERNAEAGRLVGAGDVSAAVDLLAEAGAAAEQLGWLAGAASFDYRAGHYARRASDYERTLDLWQRRVQIERRRGNAARLIKALTNLGSMCSVVGDYDGGFRHYTEALAVVRASGETAQKIRLLQNLALVHERRGRFGQAQRVLEQALDAGADSGLEGELLLQLAEVRSALGEHEDALRRIEEARRFFEARKDATGVGRCFGATSGVHLNAKRYAQVLESARRTVEHFRGASQPVERALLAAALSNVGAAQTRLGRMDEGIAAQREALAILTDLNATARATDVRLNLAFAYAEKGDLARAEAEYVAVKETGVRMASPRVLALARFGLARVLRDRGRLEDAAREADAAIGDVETQAAGLAEGLGAGARSHYDELFGLAVGVAVRQERPAAVFAALERGRAMALLESLDTLDDVRAAQVPAALREMETKARTAARSAQLRYGQALADGNRQLVTQRRAELDAARSSIEEVVRRIQRNARSGVQALYPRPIGMKQIQTTLGADEALLLYAALEKEVIALVVTSKEARIARIGGSADVARTCAAIAAAPSGDLDPRAASLVKPLRLAAGIRRVLVSPDGALFQVPFALLLPKREIAYVPSATTVARLRTDTGARGKGVLALGDPAYEKGVARLPATRAEASDVGTDVLLQEDATVEGFVQALPRQPRWRAVHFACHGVFDPTRPMRSALVLAPSEASDGRLTALDLCGLAIPADLAVLSACETGRGRAYGAEGLVGLARAFLVAGVPRVIVSLWKVDDAATKALMVKFYELWKTEPAATALKKAQEHVRKQKQWKHPYYWAAWQLWGLPD